jgi:hypothetical protein
LEAGLASVVDDDEIRWRVSFSAALGFKGSHDATIPGTPEVPYRHQVDVNVFNLTPQMIYPLTETLNLEIGIPLRRIVRTASIVADADTSEDAREEMQRNVDIHHASKTLNGVGDLSLWLRPRQPGNPWTWGMTLPIGSTQEDPYVLGLNDDAHEHIQFGTGTVVPRLQYLHLAEDWIAMTTLSAPFYANSHGFRAPPELGFYAARRGSLVADWVWSFGVSARLQGYGDWNGTRDVNTGYGALVADGGLTWTGSAGRFIFGVTYPLAQELWDESGDAFELGPTFAVSFVP